MKIINNEIYGDSLALLEKSLKLCLIPEKYERKKIGRKNGRKEKVKEMNIKFYTYLVIHGKFKEKKFIFFCLVNHEKKSQEKMEGK